MDRRTLIRQTAEWTGGAALSAVLPAGARRASAQTVAAGDRAATWMTTTETARWQERPLRAAGWPYRAWRDWWEMDHIVPYSEGGLTVLENVRTLCVICHRERSGKQAKERAARKRASKARSIGFASGGLLGIAN